LTVIGNPHKHLSCRWHTHATQSFFVGATAERRPSLTNHFENPQPIGNMRRSKSNPATYVRNYRQLSQRRTSDLTDLDGGRKSAPSTSTEEEICRIRAVLEIKHEAPPATKSDEDNTNKSGQDSILSKELQAELSEGYNNSMDAIGNAVLGTKQKSCSRTIVPTLSKEELKQEKQQRKKLERKLAQLEKNLSAKQRRSRLYEQLQETALSPLEQSFLQSSATLDRRKTRTKRQKTQHALLKERAGLELSETERDYLYDRKQSPVLSSPPPLPDKAAIDGAESFANEPRDRDEDSPSNLELAPPNASLVCTNADVSEEADRPLKEGPSLDMGGATSVNVNAAVSNVAAQIMSSLSSLKASSNRIDTRITSTFSGTDEAMNSSREHMSKDPNEKFNSEAASRKPYLPPAPVILKDPASLGIKPVGATPGKMVHMLQRKELRRPPAVVAQRYELPVMQQEFEVVDTIRNNDVTIICGETGSGKSTQVPQLLWEAGMTVAHNSSGGSRALMIGVTQPRRVAAVSTAKRVCYEMGHGDGKTITNRNKNGKEGNLVAYQTRYESAGVGSATEIKFMTDGILLQEMKSDFLLRHYSIIILDEAHERNLNTDILIGLLSTLLPLRKQAALEDASNQLLPLRVVIMSATLRVEDFTTNPRLFASSLLPLSTLKSGELPSPKLPSEAASEIKPPQLLMLPGRLHPVTIHHAKETEMKDYGKHKQKLSIIPNLRVLALTSICRGSDGVMAPSRTCRNLSFQESVYNTSETTLRWNFGIFDG
jgi:DEAD/DEAH box helicase